MDKNYNVDDILSEIKERKSREKTGGTGKQGTAANRQGEPDIATELARHTPPDAPSLFASSGKSARPTPEPVEDTGPQEGLQFQFPAAQGPSPSQEEQRGGRNPLDFTGHVRPLTDRARMHPSKLSQPKQLQHTQEHPDLQFRTEAGHEPSGKPAIDFSRFRAPKLDDDGHAAGKTRVLPQFHTGQELSPEDIRQIDFSKVDEGMGSFYEDEEDDFQPGSASVDYSEYNSKSDRRDVALDIARVKLWLIIRAGLSLVLTIFLFLMVFSTQSRSVPVPIFLPVPESSSPRTFILVQTLLTALVGLVCSSSVGGGIISLFKMRANSDTLAALALLAAAGQGIVAALKPDLVDLESMNLYFSIAALAMLFNALGKMTMINRIQSNFRIIASERPKRALLAVESDSFCHEFLPDATRRPTIAYSVKADFFTDFLGLSYSDKYDVGINRIVAPICLGVAVVVGVTVYFLSDTVLHAVSAYTAVLCVCASLSATFIENIPLGKLTKKLAPQGGMVSGNKAVEDFCDTKALVLTELDLFPKGHVTLHGIKAFSKGRIDEAILDAASVICAMDAALSPIFLEMIGGNQKLLRGVDNIVYEQGMGVSAWVNSHRVLIGNRQMMANHGITLPSDKYERGEKKMEGEPLYLSSSGEASARFLVSYRIDEELAEQLDLLAARETRLIVYTSDANLTPHKLWELYGYPEDLIDIMPTRQQGEYREMSAPRDNAVAEIVYTGRASVLVKSIVACVSARASILSATVIQLLQILLGYGLVAFIAFISSIESLSIVELGIYQLFWFFAIFLVQKTRQI